MESPGSKNILVGLIIFVIGAFITFATYSAASGGGRYVVAYGAIAVGAGQFLFGLVQLLSEDSSGSVDRVLSNATPEFKALLRTWISASEIDGPLDSDKIYIIRDMAFKLTGEEPYATTIKDVAAAMKKEKIKTTDYLKQVQSSLTPEIRQLLVRTSMTLLATQKAKHESAMHFINEIAAAPGLAEQQPQGQTRT
jgi:hypothetical protein